MDVKSQKSYKSARFGPESEGIISPKFPSEKTINLKESATKLKEKGRKQGSEKIRSSSRNRSGDKSKNQDSGLKTKRDDLQLKQEPPSLQEMLNAPDSFLDIQPTKEDDKKNKQQRPRDKSRDQAEKEKSRNRSQEKNRSTEKNKQVTSSGAKRDPLGSTPLKEETLPKDPGNTIKKDKLGSGQMSSKKPVDTQDTFRGQESTLKKEKPESSIEKVKLESSLKKEKPKVEKPNLTLQLNKLVGNTTKPKPSGQMQSKKQEDTFRLDDTERADKTE